MIMPLPSRARFLALAVAGGAAAGTSSRAASGQALTPLRIIGNPNDDSTSLYYAMKSGMFERAGLELHIETATSGAAGAAAVVGGNADIGKSSITSIFEAHEKGVPLTLLAPAGIQETAVPFINMIVLKEMPLHSGKVFENQIVGLTSLSSIGRAAVCSWVETNGGDWHAVKFVEIPLTQAAAAVEQKRVIAAETAKPLLATALATGKFQVLPAYQMIAPRFLLTTWYTTKDWSTKHPEAARSFARIISTAAAYANAHHSETAPIMAAAANLDVTVIQGMQRIVNGTVLTPALLQPAINISARYGELSAPFPAQEIIDANAAPK